MRVKESKEVGLKFNIQERQTNNNNNNKTKIMASDPITLWQVDGEKVGAVADVIFLGFKVTVDGDCSH